MGRLPASVTTQHSLADLVELQRGYDLTAAERMPGPIPVIGGGGPNGTHDKANVTGPGVVVVRSGSGFGNVWWVENDFWAHNTVMFARSFKGNHKKFVYYVLSWLDFTSYNSGGAQPSLNRNFIYSIPVFLPSLSEQERIAGIIETWDRAIDTVEALIANARAQKKALMQSLLTGNKRLPGFTEEWSDTTLAALLTGKRAKGKIVSTNDEGLGVPYIGSASFLGNFSAYTTANDALLCRRDDILMLWDGEYAGKVAFGLEGAVSSTVTRYRLDPAKADTEFVVSVLDAHSDRIRDIREGSGIPHMPGDFEHWFKLRLPPLDEQKAIAAALMTHRSTTNTLQTQVAALRQEKSALMQQLLTGKRRVKAPDSEVAHA